MDVNVQKYEIGDRSPNISHVEQLADAPSTVQPESASLLLGVMSDTHGHSHNTLDGLRLLESLGVEQILHCGDVGSPELPRLFTRPTHFVFGNVDHDWQELEAAIVAAGHKCYRREGNLVLANTPIAWLHGDDEPRREALLRSGAWRLVCCGHTHRREWRRIGDTWLLNPGALYRATPHSVATVRLPDLEVQFWDC